MHAHQRPVIPADAIISVLDPVSAQTLESKHDDLKSVVAATVTELELSRETSPVPEQDDGANLSPNEPTHLISSPYPQQANQLDLRTLGLQERLFAHALVEMHATRSDYATAPYLESFTWDAVFARLRELSAQKSHRWQRQEFYVVVFRSKLRPTADRNRLGELDCYSHQEACASGGLLKYWFGSPNDERRNLATCLWRNREDAAAGGKGPWHKKARSAARELYEEIQFLTYRMVIDDGAAEWRLEDYAEQHR